MQVVINHRENQNLTPYQLPNKELYHRDLFNIEGSWTGRMDAQIANTFIHEAVQLIANAIRVYEFGYFDCAYYSLRQSIEVSTSIVYLMELEGDKREEALMKWRAQSDFPMFNGMIKFLNKNARTFADIRNNMASYFEELQEVKERLNKLVHKLGFNTFYVSRNHPLNKYKDMTPYHDEFIYLLERCIGAVSILRLAIDPFPVLLMDEEIYMRAGDTLTEPYTEEFVVKYIGSENIEAYKRTELYSTIHQAIMKETKMLPAVVDVVKNHYVDREIANEILSQSDLLGYMDMFVVLAFGLSNKIAIIYAYDGMRSYFSNIKTVRQHIGYNSLTFKEIKRSNKHYNVMFEEAFLSYINANGEDLYLEHNEPFDEEEYSYIVKMLTDLNTPVEKDY
ncbi:hypothetical protein DFQ01_109130 [Paenibacillus cellulosilyticus]|uniref:HEPN domain-containing protein n=1 Tax=Paenibacillus cellulosilyticus TaxID=375489 RepID=A0A2V2Z1Z4_9BACL|nr:teicoplanin resistance protein VanZ [Paenibacillus cellulosilyticus]PWW02505.1 hypothetical protein DFQ01_109130 [Paenibacillus cellulosilyticus]QKS47207.1 teicoplanin resistance protein VanZ [Paenibacillus cellulosilyticus]